MTRVALLGFLSRKLRAALTMIAILLGVSMISGTFVLTDTINGAFSQIFHQANQTTDAILTPKTPVDSLSRPPALPGPLLTVVRHTVGVRFAEGEVADTAELVDSRGRVVSAVSGAPSFLFSRLTGHFSQLTVVQGREPGPGEVDIDTSTVRRHHLHIGQRVGVAAAHAAQYFRIVGIVKFGTVGSLGGASIIMLDLPDAQRVADKVGKFDAIRVSASAGVSPTVLVRRLKASVPPSLRGRVKVQTGAENAQAETSAIGDAIGSLTNILLAFGFIAVFVGAFVIFNTFSITVAQRAREFALLRTVGATRTQVLRSVIVEALLIGVIASLLGLAAGFLIARGLNALFVAVGIELPSTGLVFAGRTALVGLSAGIIVTLVSSLVPAVRATRVPPIAVLREGATVPRGRWSRVTPYAAGALTALGIAMMALGIFASISQTGQRLTLIGVGALVLFLGVAMLSPRLVGPMAAVIGWPIERFTAITGRLARDNAVRNPSRTAISAAALMIGLAVVGFVTIFAAELKKTADDAITRELAGTYAIYSSVGQLIPADAARTVGAVPGVEVVSSLKVDNVRLQGLGDYQTNGLQPASSLQVYHFQWKQGSDEAVRHMGPHDAFVDENLANGNHLSIGSALHAVTPAGVHDTFHVTAIYKNTQLIPNLVVRYDTMARDWQQPKDQIILVSARTGQNINALKVRIAGALSGRYPTAEVHSQQDIRDQQASNINKLLALIYVLLAMSVIVSLFGIINTLILSVYERTREIGMLRAIGTSRGQVRWMIRWESVITAVIGAILGLALGIVLAFLVTRGLQSQGIEYALPLVQLLVWVVFAVLFGIVAAAYPARRAARLDVLQAISYE